MLNRLKTYLQYGNHFCGIEHSSTSDGDFMFSTLLKKIKNTIEIATTNQASSIEDICNTLPKKQHTFLIINNNQVLSKAITSELSDSNRLVNKAFPNIDLNDFYYEVLPQNNSFFISIVRRDYLENILNTYKKKSISILDISLGNQIAATLKDYINSDSISTSNAIVSFKNSITSIETNTNIHDALFNVNGLEVNSDHILSLGGALQSLLKNNSSNSNISDLKLELLDNYKHTRFFSEFLKYGLVFFFSILLINFLFFNHYHTKVNALNTLSEVNKTSKETVLKLDEDVKKKETMVNDMLKSGSSKTSFYTNAIVQSMPKSILLSELNYQPLLKRIKGDKPVEVNNRTILVSGDSNDSVIFSKWVSQLEAKDWIQKIDINYGKGSGQNSDFKLTITLHNDK